MPSFDKEQCDTFFPIPAYLNYIQSGLYIIDCQHRVIYQNAIARQITGSQNTADSYFCTHSRHMNIAGDRLCNQNCPLKSPNGPITDVKVYIRHKEDYLVEMSLRCFPIFDTIGKLIGAGQSFNPISFSPNLFCRPSCCEELAIQNYHDSLTGLKNRRFAESFLSDRLKDAKQKNESFALLFLDLDEFKSINDHYGHAVGDHALKSASQVISQFLRAKDMLIRWGGDEFIVVPGEPIHPQNLKRFAENLCRRIAGFHLPDITPPRTLTLSIGGTCSLPDDSVITLVNRADQNMYASKQNGGNGATVSLENSISSDPERSD